MITIARCDKLYVPGFGFGFETFLTPAGVPPGRRANGSPILNKNITPLLAFWAMPFLVFDIIHFFTHLNMPPAVTLSSKSTHVKLWICWAKAAWTTDLRRL